MSREKKIPVVGLDNLIPPYRSYKFFTFGEGDDARPLTVEDERHGLGRGEVKKFRLADAWWLAEAATLVYDDPATTVRDTFRAAGFDDVKFVNNSASDTQVFVAHNARHVVVAFRGTESGQRAGEVDFSHIFMDAATNANFKRVAFGGAGAGEVHRGFKRAVESVWGELSAHLSSLRDGRRAFWLTGHSLGAALATIAAAKATELPGFDLRGLYTFGSPLVGDKAFKTYFETALRKAFKTDYYRFVHQQDIVTTVPPSAFGFAHVGSLRQISSDGRIRDGVGMLEQFTNLLSGVLMRSFDVFGSVNSRVTFFIPEQLKHHVPTLYATHIWNAHVREVG